MRTSDASDQRNDHWRAERFEDDKSGWIVLESITVNRRLGGLLFSRCTLPPIDGRGNASPGTKRVIAGSPVLHLFHDRRELSTTRDVVWRAFMRNSSVCNVPSMCKYICIHVCVVFFPFRNCFQRPVIANCRLDQGKLIEFVDHRWTLLSSTYIAKWWMWNCIFGIGHVYIVIQEIRDMALRIYYSMIREIM